MFPEHTALAYREAARQGADLIECDLAITKVNLKLSLNHLDCWENQNHFRTGNSSACTSLTSA